MFRFNRDETGKTKIPKSVRNTNDAKALKRRKEKEKNCYGSGFEPGTVDTKPEP